MSVLAANPSVLTLEQSTNNMGSWQEVALTTDMVTNSKLIDAGGPGQQQFLSDKNCVAHTHADTDS